MRNPPWETARICQPLTTRLTQPIQNLPKPMLMFPRKWFTQASKVVSDLLSSLKGLHVPFRHDHGASYFPCIPWPVYPGFHPLCATLHALSVSSIFCSCSRHYFQDKCMPVHALALRLDIAFAAGHFGSGSPFPCLEWRPVSLDLIGSGYS